MPQETYLERKLRQLGLSQDHSSTANGSTIKRLTFRLYFPRPPYGPVEYLAAKQGDGLNFVGQLLGHGGCTLKRIQTDSGTRVEVHDGKGNLNGTHPSYTDPSLHAVVFSETKEKLIKATKMIAEVLAPINGSFEKFEVIPGGSALLKPALKGHSKKSENEESLSSNGGESQHTPDENDDLQAPDLDSILVPTSISPSSPWTRTRDLKRQESDSDHSPLKVKPDPNKKVEKEEVQRVKAWNTWGQNKQDAYSQFTTLTQSLVSHYANQSKLMRRNFANQGVVAENGRDKNSPFVNSQNSTKGPSPWKGSVSFKSTFGQNYPHFGAPFEDKNSGPQEIGLWENMPESTESCPLPNLYEDLTGSKEQIQFGRIEDSRFVQLGVSLDSPTSSKMKTNANQAFVHRGVCLPHNI